MAENNSEVNDVWQTNFFNYLAVERQLSQNTQLAYGRAIKKCEKWLKKHQAWKANDWASVTQRELRDFFIEEGRLVSRRSVHQLASALRAFFKFNS